MINICAMLYTGCQLIAFQDLIRSSAGRTKTALT